MTTKLDVLPATPDRWSDVEAVFGARGCSVARGCWCMFYRHSGRRPALPEGVTAAAAARAELKALVDAGAVPGLIGYREGQPVGWVSIAPRAQFAKLERSPVMRAVDDAPVWSVVCFVVPAPYRGQGVARALLDGAIAYAGTRGARIVESYPVETRGRRRRDDDLWFGVKAMYDDAGFEEVARRKPARPVLRLKLG